MSDEASAGLLADELARLPAAAILDERRLASILAVSPRTVRRMVGRRELPAPIRLGGRTCWLAGRVVEHLAARAEAADRQAERENRRLAAMTP